VSQLFRQNRLEAAAFEETGALEAGGNPPVGTGLADGGSDPMPVASSGGGGCGCSLGGLAPSATPAGVVLAGLALLVRRSPRRSECG
jgi:MYXO-CTERM domain-containing protein